MAKQPNYRQVVISAQSEKHRPPPKLTAKDLRLYQGNKQAQIVFFQPQPAAVAILVDTSGSMVPKLPICRSALKAFISDLNPSDDVSLLAFSGRVVVLVEPTTDHASVINSLDMLHAFGQTALYDSVAEGLRTVSQSCARDKALLLITDGMDTASSSSLGQASEMAQRTRVPIYSIGIGNPKSVPPVTGMNSYTAGGTVMGMGINPHTAGVDDRVDTRALGKLAQDTGGKTFVVGLDDNGEALKQATKAIADKIGNRYIVGFIGDGSANQLRIEAPEREKLTLRIIAARWKGGCCGWSSAKSCRGS